jgi:hypothetical protein
MTFRKRTLKRVAFASAVAVAISAGALTSAGQSAPGPFAKAANGPSASTAGLNARYTACLRSNGATWTRIPNGDGFFRVDIPAAANAQCAGLDLAREAAAQGDASTASWLAKIDSAPAGFWSCVGAAGFHTSGGAGQRSDYASEGFAATARGCASSAGIALPVQ